MDWGLRKAVSSPDPSEESVADSSAGGRLVKTSPDPLSR